MKSSLFIMSVLRCLLVVEKEMEYKILYLTGEVRTRLTNLKEISISVWSAIKAMD